MLDPFEKCFVKLAPTEIGFRFVPFDCDCFQPSTILPFPFRPQSIPIPAPATRRSLKPISRALDDCDRELLDEKEVDGGRAIGAEEEEGEARLEESCEELDVESTGTRSGCRDTPIIGRAVDWRTGEEMTDCRFGKVGLFFFGDIRLVMLASDDSVVLLLFCVESEVVGASFVLGRFGSGGAGFRAGGSTRSTSASDWSFVAIPAVAARRDGLC